MTHKRKKLLSQQTPKKRTLGFMQNKTSNHNTSLSPKVKEAITRSRISETARQTVLVYHTTRLDNLLLSNCLERIKIKPDGNSFLNAIIERK
jgi:hypothetical protein